MANSPAGARRTDRQRLHEYESAWKRIMDEECAPDEVHCSCVPGLKMRIRELDSRIAEQMERIRRLVAERDMWRYEAMQRIALRREIEELLGMQDGETYTDAGMKKAIEILRILTKERKK